MLGTRNRRLSGTGVFALGILFIGILTLWVPAYWPVTAFHLGAFCLFGFTFYRDAEALRRHVLTPPLMALGLVTLWGVIQLLLGSTVGPLETKTSVLSWAALFSMFLAGLGIFEDHRTRLAFRTALLWFTFLTSVIAILQLFTSGGKVFWIFTTEYKDTVVGPILNPNHFAAWIELILPIALYAAYTSRRSATLYAGMAAVMYAAVISSASRAGIVLCTVELILVPALIAARGIAPSRAVCINLAKMAAAMAVFILVVGWAGVWKKVTTPDPFFLRREFAYSTLNMIRDRPWLGFGLGSWPKVYPAYATFDIGLFANRAHNQWLEWAADGGIPFALLLLFVAGWAVRPAFRTIWGLGVISLLLHALVDYPFSRPPLAAWPVTMIAMLAAANKDAAK